MSCPFSIKGHRAVKTAFCLSFLFLLVSSSIAVPSTPPDIGQLFREGEALLSRGETERALWRFKTLVTEFPKSTLCNEAKFRMGVCYTQLKRPKDAIRTLNELFSTFPAPPRMVQILTLLGDNYMELKDPVSALQWYGKALITPGSSGEELKKVIRSIIDSLDSEESFNSIESTYRGAYAGGYAKLKLAQLARRRGNEALARKHATELTKEYREIDYGPQLKDLFSSIPAAEKSKYILGVILPLSGIYRPFGEKALQAIQLAIKQTEIPGKTPLIALAVRDSKGDPGEAEKAVDELASREKPIGIIGALLTSTVERTAKRCQQVKIPLIILSQKEPLATRGDFLFQNSLTPSAQVGRLADFATRELELRTFSVFYPNSPYGHHFKKLFAERVARNGGQVIGSVAYPETQNDFSQEIKTFFRIKGGGQNDSASNQQRFAASLSVDGLFIPDTYDHAAEIMTQLEYYNVKGLTLLGTNAWNHPGLVSAAGRASEGSILVDAFVRTNSSSITEQFLREFRKAYSRDPGTLEALSYESAGLVRDLLRAKEISSPAQMKDEIRRIANFQGICGLRGFGENGTMIRDLSILRVHNGQIEVYSPSS
jgi:branched-chain amino acid transport system substrate-binding protein